MAKGTTKMTETTQAVMTEYPARLQMSMLAPVKKIADLIKDGDKEARVVGYIFGTARGVSFRNNPNSADGQAAAALIGVFEGIPSYKNEAGLEEADHSENRPRLASGVCFLPQQAQDTVVAAILAGQDRPDTSNIKRGQRMDQLGVEVPISIEVAIRKSGSPVGYEWVVRGLANVKAQSPIERMRESLGLPGGADLHARIADGTLAKIVTNTEKAAAKEAGVALPAPAKKKTGSKKR